MGDFAPASAEALGDTTSGTIVNNDAILTVWDNVQVGAEPLTLNGAGTPDFVGVISGSGRVIQNGAGTTLLRATNTYAGGTRVNAGVLQISSDGNLGAAAGAVTLGAGTLQTITPRSFAARTSGR